MTKYHFTVSGVRGEDVRVQEVKALKRNSEFQV